MSIRHNGSKRGADVIRANTPFATPTNNVSPLTGETLYRVGWKDAQGTEYHAVSVYGESVAQDVMMAITHFRNMVAIDVEYGRALNSQGGE